MWLGNSINCTRNATKSAIMQKLAKDVFESLLKGQEGAKETVIGNSKSVFGIMLLGHLLGESPKDQELLDVLVERSNATAFNDSCDTALDNIQFFRSFFQNLDEVTLMSKIIPTAQVASRREDKLLSNMAFLAESLSFKFSAEVAKQFTTEILSADDLSKDDPKIVRLLTAICMGLDDSALEAFEDSILRGFLLKASQNANADSTNSFERKMQFVSPTFLCIGVLGARVSTSFVEEAATTFLTLLMSDVNDTTIPDSVVKQFKTERVSTSAKVLSCIQNSAAKIQSAT